MGTNLKIESCGLVCSVCLSHLARRQALAVAQAAGKMESDRAYQCACVLPDVAWPAARNAALWAFCRRQIYRTRNYPRPRGNNIMIPSPIRIY